jgi:formyl-CoA transferase
VHTSLLEAQIAMLDFQAARWLIDGEVPPQAGNDHPTGIPTGVFPTSDGQINIAAANGRLFRRLCDALNAPELPDDPDYASGELRSQNRAALNLAIGDLTKGRTSAEWVERLNEAGVPCGPINSVDETFADPQVQHLGIVTPVDDPTRGRLQLVGQAVNMARTPQPKEMRRPSPGCGEHTEEILEGLGLDAKAIADLRAQRVI